MILMRHGCPKERHNAVAHDLVDRPLVAVHGGHHAFQDRIEELPGLFGVAIGQQFHRAFEVGKQHGHLLAFAFQGTAGGENFLGEIGGRVARGADAGAGVAAGAGGEADSPVQTNTVPCSSVGDTLTVMSSILRSSSATSSSWNCRLSVR